MIYKKEFYRLREIIQSDNVKIYAYKNKSCFKDNDATGYANIWDRKITVACKPSYKFGVMRLLHEYGHLLDYDRWQKSHRWSLYSIYLLDDEQFFIQNF